MKKLLTILFFLPLFVKAQNPNFVPGVQKLYTIAGRSCLVWTPDTTISGKKFVLGVHFTGNSCNDSAAAVNQGWAKRVRVTTTGLHRDSMMHITYIRTVGENSGVTDIDIVDRLLDTVYKYAKWIDTTATNRNFMSGLSQGAQELYRYLSNWSATGGEHRAKFKTQVIMSGGAFNDPDFVGFRVHYTHVSFNTSDATVGSYYNAHLYDLFLNTYHYSNPLTRKIELAGSSHGTAAWDSTTSQAGADANSNVTMWILSPSYNLSNYPPVADAGNTLTLAIAATSTSLDGSASYDPDAIITTYAWTQISGASSTIVSASSVTTSITGLAPGIYRYKLIVTDDDGATANDTVSVVVTNPRHQITVPPANMFRNGGRDGVIPYTNFLDGDTTNNACPLTFGTSGIDLPNTGIVMLDSTYENFAFELRNLGGGGSTVINFWLYNDARTDSLAVSVSTAIDSWNWVDSNRSKGVHFPVRWIEWSTSLCFSYISEMRFHGTAVAAGQQIFPTYTAMPVGAFTDFLGSAVNGDDPDSLYTSIGKARVFAGHWYFDSTATLNTSARNFIFNFFGGNNTNALVASYRARGVKLSYATFGAVRSVHNPVPNSPLSYGSFSDDQKNMPYGYDSTLPASWIVTAQNGYALALWGGRNSAGSFGPHTAKTGGGVNVTKGNDWLYGIEEGNESNASWTAIRYQTSKVRMAKQSAFYDGHMGALGSYAGVKNADSTMLAGVGALVGYDSTTMKTDALFDFRLRGLANQAWDYYCINQYFTYTGEQSFSQPSLNGISPGQFNWYNRALSIVATRNRYMPGKRIHISEFGWDKNGSTSYSALAHGSLDSEVVQANYIHLALHIGRAAGIDEMDQYRSLDQGVLANSSDFTTSGNSSGYPDYTRWAANFWMSTMKSILTGYDSALPTLFQNGDSTDLYVFKYQTSLKDTIVFVIQSGTNDDSHFDYDLNVGETSYCQVITMAKGDLDGVRTTGTPAAGLLHLDDVGETPVYVRIIQAGTPKPAFRNRFRL